MSIPVEITDLSNAMARYRVAYLLTSRERAAPHAVAVTVSLQGESLLVQELGRRSRENAVAQPSVSLLWPPAHESDYSLIVDGEASIAGEGLRIVPTRAVLHRPVKAPRSEPAEGCGSDCVELEIRRV